MNRTKALFIIWILILVVSAQYGYSLTEDTHDAINQWVATRQINSFSLNDYLINNLGFKGGARELFFGHSEKERQDIKQEVLLWLGEGGVQEDRPGNWWDYTPVVGQPTRSVSHFHNPLKEWGAAGLDDTIGGRSYTGQSQVAWAQNRSQDPGGHWSWYDARAYYYIALTAVSKTNKDTYFVNTFSALGHLMHLVQDASVPEHVRNQIHVRKAYEYKVEQFLNDKDKSLWNSFMANPIGFDKSILQIPSTDFLAPLPISRIVDTDLYHGDNPDSTRTQAGSLQPIGLSEYTNANFMSRHTMLTDDYNSNDRRYFPYPRAESTSRWKDAKNGNKYLKKIGDGDNVDHLAVLSFLDSYRARYFPEYHNRLPLGLDDECYKEYASKLIPRAVGYSAGLLEYFFRGKLQVTSLPVIKKNEITSVIVKVKNLTSTQESMKNGTFALTYRYTPKGAPSDGTQDSFGQAWASVDSPVAPCTILKYQEDEIEIEFGIPRPIPRASYDSAKFTLAFRGTLESKDGKVKEDGAVIGKVFTLGKILFEEEWDNGLTGNHTWAHVDFGTAQYYLGHGITSNTIEGDTLIKENIRDAGFKNPSANGSFVGIDSYYPGYQDNLPILITPSTSLQFKIDKMSINQIPPCQPGSTCHYQGLWLFFNHGLVIQFSTDQFVLYTPLTAYGTFDLGETFVDNIYKLFGDAGVTIPPGDLYLEKIDFTQQLFEIADPSAVEHYQHMEVDFIRIIEEKLQE